MEPMERAHEEIRRLNRLNRNLRNEIRVLHQRLRDANRGAERKMHVKSGECTYVVYSDGSRGGIVHAGDCRNPNHKENQR